MADKRRRRIRRRERDEKGERETSGARKHSGKMAMSHNKLLGEGGKVLEEAGGRGK